MDKELDIISQHLSHNLIELRQKRNLTQEALAKLTGLPRSTIANFESGVGNPSLLNLAKLSNALSIPLEYLLKAPKVSVSLIPSKDVPLTRKSNEEIKIFQIFPDPLPNMNIERMELKSGSFMRGTPHISGTKEYFHCVKGQMQINVMGNSYFVNEGDVLIFPGDVNHAYANKGKVTAVGISVVLTNI